MLSKTGEIRRDESCLDYSGTDVILYPCHGSKGNQQWTYNTQVYVVYTRWILCRKFYSRPSLFALEMCIYEMVSQSFASWGNSLLLLV